MAKSMMKRIEKLEKKIADKKDDSESGVTLDQLREAVDKAHEMAPPEREYIFAHELMTQSAKCKACRECCEYVEFPVTMLSLEVVEYFIFRGDQAHIDQKNGVMSIRMYKPCQHLTEQGCGIYDDRPETCRLYMCDIKDKSIKELKQAMFEEGTRLILQAIQTNREKKK